MIPTIKPKIRSHVALFGVCITTVTTPLIAAENTQFTVAGSGGAHLRVEAVDPSIVRLWLKPAGEFTRAQSLAMETAPSSHMPPAVSESGDSIKVRTEALTILIDRQTLALANEHSKQGVVVATSDKAPVGFEISLVTPDVPALYARALKAGATAVSAPEAKPWGQTVAYLRDKDGHLVGLGTPLP